MIDDAEAKANAESPSVAPKPERKRDRRLYSPQRRGFMRATIEEGIRAELDAMNSEARGTPFFDAAPAERAAVSGTKTPLGERLAMLPKKKP